MKRSTKRSKRNVANPRHYEPPTPNIPGLRNLAVMERRLFLAFNETNTDVRLDRPKAGRPLFDLRFSGRYEDGTRFRAWLPLHVIGAALYNGWANRYRLAAISDYPEMVRSGDWSGIRDSSPQAIYRMFSYALRTYGWDAEAKAALDVVTRQLVSATIPGTDVNTVALK